MTLIDIENKVRETPLLERLKQSQNRIGQMCKDGRCPQMSVPVSPNDDDVFICTTLEDVIQMIEPQHAPTIEPLKFHLLHNTNMTTTPTPKPPTKTVDLMIDIETMGNTPGCAILSIGAVFIKDGKLAEEFYQKVDLQSCLDVGLKMDASTVLWWMKQSDEARASITDGKSDHIIEVLGGFARWVRGHVGFREIQVWGNAATFDVVLMEEAFRKTHINIPWEFWGHRCFRTLKNLCPSVPKPEFTGIKHHALDDAKHQALHMIAILEHINCLQNALDSATKPNTPNEQEKPTIQSPGFVATHTACTTGRFASTQESDPAGEDGIPGFYDTGTPEDPAASVSGTPEDPAASVSGTP